MNTNAEAKCPVLFIEDDQAFRAVYSANLEDEGYKVSEAETIEQALSVLASGEYPLVLLDLVLTPGGTADQGLDLLSQIKRRSPFSKIVVVSGEGKIDNMTRAVRSGAYDFLTKPVDLDLLLVVMDRARTRYALERRIDDLQSAVSASRPENSMIGSSPCFVEAVRLAEKVAASDLPVLITGESGTGKELTARAIHNQSRRSNKAFVAANCAALPENLLESTLFGHKKGAFTGASSDRKGLFSEADGGTIFLDEIADAPLALQAKLLRALELGEIMPVGAVKPQRVDVRILSATNRNLKEMSEQGTFREDLYWRIKGVNVHLPPLRERPEDIETLAVHFLNLAAHISTDGTARTLTGGAVRALKAHAWPGNLRELRHEMQRATIMAGPSLEIFQEDLSFTASFTASVQSPALEKTNLSLPEKVERLEIEEIRKALASTGGNRSQSAELLGLSRQGLLKKMDRYGLR